MHTLEVSDGFAYLGNMAFLLGVVMVILDIVYCISTYGELYTKIITSSIAVVLVVISCMCFYKSVKLSTPVEVKKTPVEAQIEKVEANYDKSGVTKQYKVELSYNGNTYICTDSDTYEKCNGKKGTKVKANLVKNVYSTGEVEYRMAVE